MKEKIKRFFASIAAIVMAVAMMGSVTAFAQEVGTASTGTGSITIKNASKGVTYTVYKLFDATLGTNDEVAYKGTVPEGLTDYFEETSSGSGYVQAKPAAYKGVTYYTDNTKATTSETPTDYYTITDDSMSDGLRTALATWAKTATAAAGPTVSDGTELKFQGLAYGYYVVTTNQGEQAISVDTTQPNVDIYDKNSSTYSAQKTVGATSYSVGDTITYTATFNTTNYIGSGSTAEQVKSYTISDTLPEFLSDVKITSVKVVQDTTDKTTYPDQDLSSSYTTNGFGSEKKIVIPWVDETDTTKNLYKNGSVITITYTATLTSTVNVNADNTNTVTITPNKDRSGDTPFSEHKDSDAKITTYAAALKKTDGTKALAGAKFNFKGLTTTKVSDGVYQVTAYDSTSNTYGTEMEVDSNGKLYIIGLGSGVSLTGQETEAPKGYNKLTDTITLTPQVLSSEVIHKTETRYYDAKGNLMSSNTGSTTTKEVTNNLSTLDEKTVEVVNKAGTELPSTGGIGTTIFYVIGGCLVAAAAVILIARKRRRA